MRNEVPGPWPHETTSQQREPIFGEICADCKKLVSFFFIFYLFFHPQIKKSYLF